MEKIIKVFGLLGVVVAELGASPPVRIVKLEGHSDWRNVKTPELMHTKMNKVEIARLEDEMNEMNEDQSDDPEVN